MNFGQPYFNQYGYQQQMYQPQYQPMQQPKVQQNFLQGKTVDNIDVVKAMEIPLDGTPSYFPMADGSAIILKKLNMDGTSQTVIYKPQIEETKEKVEYITKDEFQKAIEKYDISDIEEEIKALKKKIDKLTDKGGK